MTTKYTIAQRVSTGIYSFTIHISMVDKMRQSVSNNFGIKNKNKIFLKVLNVQLKELETS
jgi:hypothetical protein